LYGDEFEGDWEVVPTVRALENKIDRVNSRKALGLAADDVVVCTFGFLDSTKQNHRLLGAWLNSNLRKDPRCKLIFVGENAGDYYGIQIQDAIHQSGLSNRIRITGWVGPEIYRHHLAAADIAVQLRSHSRGGPSGAILDCMNYSLPTIVNANGYTAELPKDAIWMIPENFEDADLIQALETLWRDRKVRQEFGARAREVIQTRHTPRECARQYAEAIEKFYDNAQTGWKALIDKLAQLEGMPDDEEELKLLSITIGRNLPSKHPAYQIMVDVSGFVEQDDINNILHSLRCIVKELLHNPPSGYRVEPVYIPTELSGYRYARKFTLQYLDCPPNGFADDPIEVRPGDVFLILEPQIYVSKVHKRGLESLRLKGIQIYCVSQNNCPYLSSENNPVDTNISQEKWLNTIILFDGIICTSNSTADNLKAWLVNNNPKCLHALKIGWINSSKEFNNSKSTHNLSNGTTQVLPQRRSKVDDDVHCLNWEQKTRQMVDLFLKGKWQTEWRYHREE